MRFAPRFETGLLGLLVVGALAPAMHASGSPHADATAGALLFATAGCTHCHGVNAQGGEVGPSLLNVGRRLKPVEISRQIHDGGAVMPAFRDSLNDDQIAQLVAYLRTLHAKTPTAAEAKSAR